MRTRIVVVSMLLAATALSGCVVAPAPAGPGPYYGEAVMVPPPAPHVEVVGAPPVVGQIWIGGYWNWVGQRHVWVPGRWEAPRPGYNWVPHRWEQRGDRWHPHGGYWSEHRRH